MFSAAAHMPRGEQRVYFFIDEFQQVISDGIKLIFEQFRDLGGTIIAAHQTAGQLQRQGCLGKSRPGQSANGTPFLRCFLLARNV